MTLGDFPLAFPMALVLPLLFALPFFEALRIFTLARGVDLGLLVGHLLVSSDRVAGIALSGLKSRPIAPLLFALHRVRRLLVGGLDALLGVDGVLGEPLGNLFVGRIIGQRQIHHDAAWIVI